MASVAYKNVYKRWGEVVAVNNLTIEIPDKEFLVFVGPSGCGKTTALRLLAGLEEVSEGEIYIGDRLINDVPPKDRDIAMVFQSYALYPHMSVYENMAFGLKLRKTPKADIDRRVKEAAEKMGIAHLLDRKPKQLSGGQRQRVAVGRAIVRNPAVFLMDEPLSNLDAKLRVQARAEISKLHRQLETTFIYVTHDQVEAMTMGTRIVVISEGKLQQVDTPQALYDRPTNKFVAGFIGSPAMNFLDAHIKEANGQLQLEGDGFSLPIPADRTPTLRAYKGKDVVLGVRPEDIFDKDFAAPGIIAADLRGKVDVTELMGNEVFLHLYVGDSLCVARVDPRTRARVGNDIDMVINMGNFHVFDKQTDMAIR
jgi:multiple sugar transport system ATP-binding protein